jgi:hypothetical protein
MDSFRKILSILTSGALHQLKAYYVSHVDSYLNEIVGYLSGVPTSLPSLPEWVVPLCALIAALITLVHVLSWLGQILEEWSVKLLKRLERWRDRK